MAKFMVLGVGIAIGVALILGAWFLVDKDYTYQGVLIDPPIPASDFELIDQEGNPFHLGDHRGKIMLLFFGYTHCPDVCPATLTEFKQVKTRLGDDSKDVLFILVTVDPERDTPEQLKSYLAKFDAEFIGLTGDHHQMEAVWNSFGVYVEKNHSHGDNDYLVDHAARTYLVDQDGNWRLNYPSGMEPEKLVRDLLHLLANF